MSAQKLYTVKIRLIQPNISSAVIKRFLCRMQM